MSRSFAALKTRSFLADDSRLATHASQLVTRQSLRFYAGAICLALATPAALALAAQPDSVVVHSIYAGKQLGDLLGGVALLARGAFTPEQAEKIQQELWNLGSQHPHQGQINKAYSYLVRPRNDHRVVLTLYLLITHSHRFDVKVVSDSRLVRALRAHLKALGIDSLIPFDRGLLTLKEERPQGEAPHLILALRTVREFACLGYDIDHELHQERDTIFLNLHGVAPPAGPCPAAVGPARMARELKLENGRYTLLVTYRQIRDRLGIDISDSATVVTGRDSSLVEADERPRWRYPRNSFAFHCSNVKARAICGDIEQWLLRQPGISQLSIPPGWINPYSPDPAAKPDEGISLFRYTDVASFWRLRLCFGAIDNQIGDAVGVFLTLENWWGEHISARSRKAYHEHHIEVPDRVTDTPACRTPRWRD